MAAGLETLPLPPDLKQEDESIVQKLAETKGLTLILFENLGNTKKVDSSFRAARKLQ